MPPDDQVRLRHMLDAARTAARYAHQHQRADLDIDELAAHGLVRLIEIIGEAAARVSPGGRAALPDLPWPAIIGMRNRLVHGYYDVDLDVVWHTLTDDLPPLIEQLERHVPEASR
jgi:uncharacterized protein with HEPN domain